MIQGEPVSREQKMTVDALQSIKKQVTALSLEDQLYLIAYLAEMVRLSYRRPRRKWMEICGIAPDLLDGVDAQTWVSRTRQEDSEHREALLKR